MRLTQKRLKEIKELTDWEVTDTSIIFEIKHHKIQWYFRQVMNLSITSGQTESWINITIDNVNVLYILVIPETDTMEKGCKALKIINKIQQYFNEDFMTTGQKSAHTKHLKKH